MTDPPAPTSCAISNASPADYVVIFAPNASGGSSCWQVVPVRGRRRIC
ncbi:MAG: hypothetical protein U0521_23415 [Anaerolineae bacterium]